MWVAVLSAAVVYCDGQIDIVSLKLVLRLVLSTDTSLDTVNTKTRWTSNVMLDLLATSISRSSLLSTQNLVCLKHFTGDYVQVLGL